MVGQGPGAKPPLVITDMSWMGRGELAGGPVSRAGVLMRRAGMPGMEGGRGAAQLAARAWVGGLAIPGQASLASSS